MLPFIRDEEKHWKGVVASKFRLVRPTRHKTLIPAEVCGKICYCSWPPNNRKAFQPEFGAYRGLARVLKSPSNPQNCRKKEKVLENCKDTKEYLNQRGTKIRVFWVLFRAPFLSPFFHHFSPLFPLQGIFALPPLLPSSPPPLSTLLWHPENSDLGTPLI